jgi:hypothetical protein
LSERSWFFKNHELLAPYPKESSADAMIRLRFFRVQGCAARDF